MSPIGRVFIVLNLLLAGLFLGYAAFYLKNHETYKDRFDKAVAAHKLEVEQLNEQISSLNTDANSTRTELMTTKTTLQQKEVQITAAEQENTSLKSRVDAQQSKLDSMDASVSQVSTTLENQNKRLEELTNNWLKAKEERNTAVKDRDSAIDQFRATEASLGKANERITSLVSELNEKDIANRKLALQIEVIKEKVPDVAAIITGALPAAEGTVMDVNTELRTVAISLGSNQAGVKKGWEFAVHDGQNYKGQIQITSVSNNMGFGRIMKQVPDQAIRKGDKASTRLR